MVGATTNPMDIKDRRRALFAPLASRNSEVWECGIRVLWQMQRDMHWIAKDDYLREVASRLERVGASLDEDDAVMAPFEDDQEEWECADGELTRARGVYARLRACGWFTEMVQNTDRGVQTIMLVGEDASRLAEFVSDVEGRRRRDEVSCVFAVKSALDAATRTLRDARKRDALGQSAVRGDTGKAIYNAVKIADERGGMLNMRLRRASSAYQLTILGIDAISDTSGLLDVMSEEYREKILKSILVPLRVDDGYERFGDEVIRTLDTLFGDSEALQLAAEAARSVGHDHDGTPAAMMGRVALAKEHYDREIREAWDALQGLEPRFAERAYKRYRLLLGAGSGTLPALEAMLLKLSDPIDVRADIAARAISEVAALGDWASFNPTSARLPEDRARADDVEFAPIEGTGEMGTMSMGEAEDMGVLMRTAKRLRAELAYAGGEATNASMPLSGREDMARQALCLMAAGIPGSGYTAEGDDAVRVREGGLDMPLITFKLEEGA